MRYITVLITAILITFSSCDNVKDRNITSKNKTASLCNDDCIAKSSSGQLSCKLTSPELQKRRETVLASLKVQMIEKKELKDGYAFKFPGTDTMIDELLEFIKTERECCDFFTFNLSIGGDKKETWLELIGTKEAKEFISTEMGL